MHSGWLNELGVRQLDYLTTHTSLSPIRRGLAPCYVNYKKRCTRLAAASGKVDQLLAHGRCFSSGIPASSTTKTGRHDIAEINQINQIKSNYKFPTNSHLIHVKLIFLNITKQKNKKFCFVN